jgi:DNA-binding transcriptional MerR regulator
MASMTQDLQFTLEQVAEHLDLPASVVKRLSQSLKIPKSYYDAPAGHPKLFLYQPAEAEILKRVQKELAAGKSLEEIRQLMDSFRFDSLVAGQSFKLLPGNGLDSTDPDDLMQYSHHDEPIKQQLAQITFNEYRQKNIMQKAPFKSLATALQVQRSLRGSHRYPGTKAVPRNVTPGPAVGSPMTRQTTDDTEMRILFPAMAPSNSWITPSFNVNS